MTQEDYRYLQDKYPGFHIVPASQWVLLPDEVQERLTAIGAVPVNDVFIRVWDRPHSNARQIDLLYGTYGSSKTVDRIQEHLLECKTEKYFKCYYGMATFERAKKELHSSIVSAIKRLQLEEEFEFSEQPNGSKVIRCIANGNRFIPFGCDNPESFKGWDDPTHIIIDEINQIDFKHYGMLQSRLRKKGAKKRLTGMFNNCDVMDDHWIRAILLNPDVQMYDEDGKTIDRNIFEHFSTFKDNYFIDQDDYKNALIEQAGDDPVRRQAILNGEWGARTTGQPFYKSFNKGVHTAPTQYNPELALHISWDENLNPYLPVGIFQINGKSVYMIDEIAAKNPYNSLRWVCREILKRYGREGKNHLAGLYIYGDATSRKDDTKMEKGRDFYTIMKELLAEMQPKMRVSKQNPNVAMRGNFINAVFGNGYGGISVTIGTQCTHAVADFINTAEAPDGNGKDKTKVTVDGIRGVQKWGHFTDLFDYMMCSVFHADYEAFQHGGRRPQWRSAPRESHNYF